ncbi:hypothetical protein J8C06_07985 [Chloracidobacterium validum]|uniref:Uncharacterized protein n=1 Tax=Chloracidobacterium validum TaxID=2821543 RepID=A0ABX8B786_9BACT|nr:hypothetical protein [Chloracidobacterium validum]QUW02297.1 hypothetical protein J8C06_07985 [Chloracidobacterium validum]
MPAQLMGGMGVTECLAGRVNQVLMVATEGTAETHTISFVTYRLATTTTTPFMPEVAMGVTVVEVDTVAEEVTAAMEPKAATV